MKLTEDQIITAIEKVAATGANPTNESVRSALGGTGSLSTITPVLRAWKAELKRSLAAQETAPKVVTDKLSRYADDIWAAAIELANARLDADRQVLRQENEKLSAHVKSLENDAIAMGIELEQMGKENTALLASNDEAQHTIEELRLELSAATERAKVAEIRLQTTTERNLELKAELANANMKNDEILKSITASVTANKASSENGT